MTNSKQELREKIVANLTKSVKEFKVAFEGGEPGYDFEPFVDEMVDTVKSEVNKAIDEIDANLHNYAPHRTKEVIEQVRKNLNNE